jgi:hypothetical protein
VFFFFGRFGGIVGMCVSQLPTLIVLAGAVFVGIWMHQKTRRDQIMIEVLAMIQQTSREIDDLLAEPTPPARRDRQQEE